MNNIPWEKLNLSKGHMDLVTVFKTQGVNELLLFNMMVDVHNIGFKKGEKSALKDK